VRADEDVDLALAELAEHLLHVGRPAEPRDHLDANGEVAVPVAERVPVLLREDRRRTEHEHLPAVDGDGEGGPDGDLSLAEADVSADQAIHRARRLEVLLDRLDRALLVVRLPVGERRLEPLEPIALELVRGPLCPLPLGVQLEKLAGELADRSARPRLEVLPGLAAELGQRRHGRVRPDVAGELADLLVGDEEAIFPAEGEMEVVARDAGHLLRVEPEELPDAVVLVDDVVAEPQLGEARERPTQPRVRTGRALPEDLRVGQERDPQLARDEASAGGYDREADTRLGREGIAQLEQRRVDLAEEPRLALGLAEVRERDDDAVSRADETRELVLRLAEAARCDCRPLRLERVCL
jgi:hypothetical protein